jgi:hypothetical protein
VKRQANKEAVVLIHGSRTQGEWQQTANEVLQRYEHLRVFPFRFEFIDVIRLLLPLHAVRLGPVKRVEALLRDVWSHDDIVHVSWASPISTDTVLS